MHLGHTGWVVIGPVVLEVQLLTLPLVHRMCHSQDSCIYQWAQLLFKYWLNLMASSTIASLTSTFLGQNLLKDLAYSPVTGRSSGLSLSWYCDGCLSTSCILYSCFLLTGPFNVTYIDWLLLMVVPCIVISLALVSIALVVGS